MAFKRARVAVALAAALLAAQANAELMNISSGAIQSQNFATISCTVIGSGGASWRGGKVIMVLSEANSAGSNPVLVSQNLDTGDTLANDTWNGPYIYNGQTMPGLSAAAVQAVLRLPGSPNDAALLLGALPGQRVCVRSSEVSGGDTLRAVALSITDVTANFTQLVGKSEAKAKAAAPLNLYSAVEAINAR